MISPDSPIERAEDDRLGRAPFAAAIAKAIRSFVGSDSFVVGINGKWGSGKSSVVNLCAAELQKQADDETHGAIDVLRFNPWNFADQNQLVLQFFRQFTGHLRKFQGKDALGLARLIESIDAYASALGPPIEDLPLPHVKLVAWLVRRGIKQARNKLGLGQDLESMFNNISEQLKNLKRKTVVIIDDLDRLNASEIRQVFQLVKVSARFPRVIYILAFDKSIIATALDDTKIGSGEEYLEKIVQVSFDLPPITESTLTKMISESLEDLLRRYPPARFDNNRFQNLFFSGFRQSFESLRDVRRFLNGLEFGFGMISKEANAVDFIGIEALRTFYPGTYEIVRRNKNLFAGHIDHAAERRGHEASKAELDRILKGTGDPEKVKELLVELFPKLEFAYSNTTFTEDSEDRWEKDLRVASSRYFDLYFQLSLPDDEVSVAEIDRAIEAARDTPEFTNILSAFVQSKRIVNAISSIRHRLSEVEPRLLPNVLDALINIGDEVEHKGSPLFGHIPEFWHIRWAIFDVLDRMPADSRFPALTEALERSVCLGTMIDIVGFLGATKKEKADRYPELTEDILKQLQSIIVQRIRECAHAGSFIDREALPSILGAWKNWGDPSEPTHYFKDVLKDPIKTIALVDKFIYQTHSAAATGKTVKTTNRLGFTDLSELVDLIELLSVLRKIAPEALSQDQRRTLQFAVKELGEFESSGLTPYQFQNRRQFEW